MGEQARLLAGDAFPQARADHFRSEEGDVTQMSELTTRQRDLHHALGVPEPPRFGRITPAATHPA